eukprot:23230_1
MSTKPPANKKRKLNNNEVEQVVTTESCSIAELILNSNINDIFGNVCMNTDQLDELSKKLVLLQNETKQRLMNSISFDKMDNVTNHTYCQNKLEKFINCIKSHVENPDEESDMGRNYFHVSSSGTFEIGPNKTQLEFYCSVGDEEGDIDGEISLDDLWNIELPINNNNVTVDLEAIKKFVAATGIKGIGDQQEEDITNYYGYYSFANDLTEICLDLIGNWSGDIDVDMSGLYNILEEGDILEQENMMNST